MSVQILWETPWGECLWRIQGEEAGEGEESPQTSTVLIPVKERQRKNWVKEPPTAGLLWESVGWANGESPKQKLPVRGVPPSSKNSPDLVYPLCLVTGREQPRGSVASAWALTHIWRCNSWRLSGNSAARRRFSWRVHGCHSYLPQNFLISFYNIYTLYIIKKMQ